MSRLVELLDFLDPTIPLVFLLSLRVGVALAALPAPFGDMAPRTVRAALALMLAIAVALPHMDSASEMSSEPAWLARAAAGEVLCGAVIGITSRIVIACVTIAGTFMGFSSGLAFAQSVDPSLGESSTPIATAMSSLAICIFFAVQGHHAVLGGLAGSVQSAPPGDVWGAIANDSLLHIGSDMIAVGLRIAAPIVATMFIVQLGMALASRAAPRVHIFQMTFAVAVSAGLLTLFVAVPSIAPTIAAEVQQLPQKLHELLGH